MFEGNTPLICCSEFAQLQASFTCKFSINLQLIAHFQEAVYRNVDASDMKNKEDETNYYNLVPYPERETDQECIYDVITEQRQLKKPTSNSSQLTTKKPVANNTKLPTINSSKTEIKPKFEETKKLSPFVSNMTTIFNKPFVKPQLREIKPPIVNKSYQ